MSAPRGLSPEEAALWARVAQSVTPLHRPRTPPAPPLAKVDPPARPAPTSAAVHKGVTGTSGKSRASPYGTPRDVRAASAKEDRTTLNSHWERHLARTSTEPDFTLDLHGHTLDQAYRRLDSGLVQAKAMDARLVLVVTGKPRPVDAADRGTRRGAIRAKILDWLAAGSHAGDIAAVRKAHRRHGGEGALYLVFKRRR